MSKSVMKYISETMNGCRNSDEDSIRACVAMDAKVTKAIEDDKIKKSKPSQENEQSTTFSVDDLKREMMRPMIDDQQIADIEKYASEQPEDELNSHDMGIDR